MRAILWALRWVAGFVLMVPLCLAGFAVYYSIFPTKEYGPVGPFAVWGSWPLLDALVVLAIVIFLAMFVAGLALIVNRPGT